MNKNNIIAVRSYYLLGFRFLFLDSGEELGRKDLYHGSFQ